MFELLTASIGTIGIVLQSCFVLWGTVSTVESVVRERGSEVMSKS